MFSNLLKGEQLCAAQPSLVVAVATGPQRLHDAPEGVERHAHVRWMGHGIRRLVRYSR